MNLKQWKRALPALLFMGILLPLSAFNILLPQKEFSQLENRSLAQFPTVSAKDLLSGKWMGAFEDYASDQFLARDRFMEWKTAADLALLRKDNGRVYFGRDGYLFNAGKLDEAQEKTNLKLTADFLNRIGLEDPNLHLSVLLAPTARLVLSDRLPAYAPVPDERKALSLAEEYLSSAVPKGVFTNPENALIQAAKDADKNKGEALPYYRTDHHWTSRGAYKAYEQWALDNGFTPLPSSAFQKTDVTKEFFGTNQAKAPGIQVEPDVIERWDPAGGLSCRVTVWKDIGKPDQQQVRNSLYSQDALSGKDKYAYFLGGNDPQTLIQTDAGTGRRLLLIKDSYANSFLPFLALHYDEILITDLRYSHGIILPTGRDSAAAPITDVLFLYNIDSFCSDRNLAYLTKLEFPFK